MGRINVAKTCCFVSSGTISNRSEAGQLPINLPETENVFEELETKYLNNPSIFAR